LQGGESVPPNSISGVFANANLVVGSDTRLASGVSSELLVIIPLHSGTGPDAGELSGHAAYSVRHGAQVRVEPAALLLQTGATILSAHGTWTAPIVGWQPDQEIARDRRARPVLRLPVLRLH
jgi:hypothetical protein